MRRFFCSLLLLPAFLMALGALACATDPSPERTDETAAAVTAARARVLSGDTAGALRELAPYVAANPGDVAAGRLLGDLYFRVPDLRRAETTWRALIARDPSDRETHNRLGGLYAVQDRLPEALAEFEKSLPLRDSFTQLIELHRRQGDLGSFMSDAYTKIEIAPLDTFALTRYGNLLSTLHRYDEALPIFKKVVGIRPSDCGALVDLANDLVDLHRLDDGLGYLQTCIKLDPRNGEALVNLGYAYYQKGDYTQALAYIDRALAAQPLNSAALVNKGLLIDVAGHSAEAMRFYQEAIAANPLEVEAYRNLGYDYNAQRVYPLAEATFLKGLSVAPLDGTLRYLLAVTYSVQGKTVLARSQLDLALQSDDEVVVKAARGELALLK